ncbi:type I polyketide synthase [Methylotuvimicrobium alcaliphilum]|uniref:Polyketide synthase putative enediyne polyketide synthase n=1 Tax=Methylotuvimicrobium alcaliphilum (strain DSM 19304 / NCIMB 14124 / VKM B-2133 / 20Z) TaxID=1091494 RepID=G4SZF5_META2|nr:type I polyketide synthase [Methylotuvimicrobium alcaliphilum]CCE23292.1 putative polyketide synthase; putative enediyne polyketide synthase [Methylotuvimicrobium alcaliphilum 20Z]
MIAIVGIACRYPDADSPQALWENVLAQRRAFRRLPSERLNLQDYLENRTEHSDSIYVKEAAVLEGYSFDRQKFRIAGSTFRSTDTTHWLALDIAARALEDAGLPNGIGLPKESTGVIVGNTLTGEFSRAALMRLRWPYVQRVLNERLTAEGWDNDKRRDFLRLMEQHYKAPFEPVGEETLAGGLANTIAGRICNFFNFQGGGFTVDGACSSSLLAVAQACTALQSGDLDAALVGGVDLSLDPFELIGFSRVGALSRGSMRVYDRNPSGFLPGEGCGFALLMRHDEALGRGLRCYGFIRGWGISSDGSGGMTRPELSGQQLAMQRAYRRAGYGIGTVPLFEGHGTGTAVGDEVELNALSELLADNRTPATIGSIKANIGHTKAAAGMAGLTKALMALHSQILPPATAIDSPHRVFEQGNLRLLETGVSWPEEQPLRAGVSSFGFGGINVHVTLEGASTARRKSLTSRETALIRSRQDCELFIFCAETPVALIESTEHLRQLAPSLSYAELTDLAAALTNAIKPCSVRAAVVAATPKQLEENLGILHGWLDEEKSSGFDTEAGVFLGCGETAPRIAFLFPGQASPVRFTGGAMGKRFSEIDSLYYDQQPPLPGDPEDTGHAQPAIALAEIAGLRLLDAVGIEAQIAAGHSLGELTALHWAGALDEQALMRIVRRRGAIMSADKRSEGAMAVIGANEANTQALIGQESGVVVAGLNSSNQCVIAGDTDAIRRVMTLAQAQDIAFTLLPITHAFHSPSMALAAEQLTRSLESENFHSIIRPVVSTVTGGFLSDIHFPKHLGEQLTSPVRFTEALTKLLPHCDLCLEVGPGRILSGLLKTDHTTPVVALDSSGPSLQGLLMAIGAAYALGQPIKTRGLFADRFTRYFDPLRPLSFLSNPCEAAPTDTIENRLNDSAPKTNTEALIRDPRNEALPKTSERLDALQLLRQMLAQKVELPASEIQDQHHLLRDLHLNSISIGQIMADAARKLNLPVSLAPTEYAHATVGQAARFLESMRTVNNDADIERHTAPQGLENWVRAFTIEQRPCELKPAKPSSNDRQRQQPSSWRVFAPEDHILAAPLLKRLESIGGTGVLLCLPPTPDSGYDRLLLDAAQVALEQDGTPRSFILVQHNGFASAFARTLFEEADGLSVSVIDTPYRQEALSWIVAETLAADGFCEAIYDSSGQRSERVLRLIATLADDSGNSLLTSGDVLLVSGGGKGIAAECAFSLARVHGLRLILLGRALPENDTVLDENLMRFSEADIAFRYYAADVGDADSIHNAVKQAESEFGAITAILHGAGVNEPRLIHDLDIEILKRTLSPKISGLKHLLASVDSGKLKLLINFSSIIGRVGMRGEADYALANAWLSHETDSFKERNPACRCLSLEWSIWSGVGMGERLGRIDTLLREGISPISPEQGIEWLNRLLDLELPSSNVVISGRLGITPPLPVLPTNELPFLRFIEKPGLFYPGIELVTDSEISLNNDPYLNDHVYQGEHIFPAVIGMEAMVQAARSVTGRTETPSFQDLRFAHPIVVPPNEIVTLRTVALVKEDQSIEVALRFSQTAFQIDHFHAILRFDACPNNYRDEAAQENSTNPHKIAIDPDAELYGPLFFQDGRFRQVKAYRQLSAFQCTADIGTDLSKETWFARFLPQTLLIGDPGTRDAALHAIQACIPHAIVLPTALERWIPKDLNIDGPIYVLARERWQRHDEFCYDLEIRSHAGFLKEIWQGLHLREITNIDWETWPVGLIAPYLQRKIYAIVKPHDLNFVLLRKDSHAAEEPTKTAIQLALGNKNTILRRSDGKPESVDGRTISVAHAEGWVFAVTSESQVACDLETVTDRPITAWEDLLGKERFALARLTVEQFGENLDRTATRVWGAIECLKKAGASANHPLTLQSAEKDGWVTFTAGPFVIATYIAKLKGTSSPLMFSVLIEQNRQSKSPAAFGK